MKKSFQKIAVFLVIWGSFTAPVLGSAAVVANFLDLAQNVVARGGGHKGPVTPTPTPSTAIKSFSDILKFFSTANLTINQVSSVAPSTISSFYANFNNGRGFPVGAVPSSWTTSAYQGSALVPMSIVINQIKAVGFIDVMPILCNAAGNLIAAPTATGSGVPASVIWYAWDRKGTLVGTPVTVPVSSGYVLGSNSSTAFTAPVYVSFGVDDLLLKTANPVPYPAMLRFTATPPTGTGYVNVSQTLAALSGIISKAGSSLTPPVGLTQITDDNLTGNQAQPFYFNFGKWSYAFGDNPWSTNPAVTGGTVNDLSSIFDNINANPTFMTNGISAILVAADQLGAFIVNPVTNFPASLYLHMFDNLGNALPGSPVAVPVKSAYALTKGATLTSFTASPSGSLVVGVGVNGSSITKGNALAYPVQLTMKTALQAPTVTGSVNVAQTLSALKGVISQAGSSLSQVTATLTGTQAQPFNVNLGGGDAWGYAFGNNPWSTNAAVTGGTVIDALTNSTSIFNNITAANMTDGISAILVAADKNGNFIANPATNFPASLYLHMFDNKTGNALLGSPVIVPVNSAYALTKGATLTSFTAAPDGSLVVGVGVNGSNLTKGNTKITYPVQLTMQAASIQTLQTITNALTGAGATVTPQTIILSNSANPSQGEYFSSIVFNMNKGRGTELWSYAFGEVNPFNKTADVGLNGLAAEILTIKSITQAQWEAGVTFLFVGVDGTGTAMPNLITTPQESPLTTFTLYIFDISGTLLSTSSDIPLTYVANGPTSTPPNPTFASLGMQTEVYAGDGTSASGILANYLVPVTVQIPNPVVIPF